MPQSVYHYRQVFKTRFYKGILLQLIVSLSIVFAFWILKQPLLILLTILLQALFIISWIIWYQVNIHFKKISSITYTFLIYPYLIWLCTCLILVFPIFLANITGVFLYDLHIIHLTPLAIIILGLTFITLIGVLYANIITSHKLRITSLTCSIKQLPKAFVNYKIVQISDLHISYFSHPKYCMDWITAVNQLQADCIMITGDLIQASTHFIDKVVFLLSQLQAKDSIIIIRGNHDFYMDNPDIFKQKLATHFTVLANETCTLTRGQEKIYVLGLDGIVNNIPRMHTVIENCLCDVPKQAPVILLAHDPIIYNQPLPYSFILALSGHTHAGQFCVPFFPHINTVSHHYQCSAGLYTRDDTLIYVNAGLGTEIVPCRIGVKPEITLLTLQ